MKREVKVVLSLAAAVTVALLAAAMFYKSRQPSQIAAPVRAGLSQELIRGDSWTLGPADAPVTVVEFLDPECESCKAFYPIMKEVLKKHEGKVHFVVRYMTFHRSSMMAVAATEAAGKQQKYWEMQERLFATAGEWGHQPTPIRGFFVSYARELGLDVDRFQLDLDDPAWATKVQRDMADGSTLGVSQTPTIFVNGVKLEDLSQEALETAVEIGLRPN